MLADHLLEEIALAEMTFRIAADGMHDAIEVQEDEGHRPQLLTAVTTCAWIFASTLPDPNFSSTARVATRVASSSEPRASISFSNGLPWQKPTTATCALGATLRAATVSA